MTKRFTQRLYETGERYLEDNETNCFYQIEDSFTNVEVLCERLNKIVKENEQLRQTIEIQNFNYENAKGVIHSSEHQIQQLEEENEYLRKLTNIKDTNAKDLVDVLNDQEAKKWAKQKHIVHLEKKIHRMREQIKKLEYLYHHRTVEIERLNQKEVNAYKHEIKKLKKENEQLKIRMSEK